MITNEEWCATSIIMQHSSNLHDQLYSSRKSPLPLYFSCFYYIEDNETFEFGGGNGLRFGIVVLVLLLFLCILVCLCVLACAFSLSLWCVLSYMSWIWWYAFYLEDT